MRTKLRHIAAFVFVFPLTPSVQGHGLAFVHPTEKRDEPVEMITPLLKAVENGDYDRACDLLMMGTDPNERIDLGRTAMHLAKRVDMLELLVTHGGDVNSVDSHNETALLNAAYDGDVKRVKYLLNHKADPNIANNNYYTPLLIGLEPSNLKKERALIAKMLIAKGAKTKISTRFSGTTPLYYAVKAGHLEIVKELIKRGVKLSGKQGDEGSPLDLVDPKKDFPMFLLLQSNNAQHYTYRNKLLQALYEDDRKAIDSVLVRIINLNFYFEGIELSPLIASVRYLEDPTVAELFIEQGAAVNFLDRETGQSPLHQAIIHERPRSLIKKMLEYEADINAKDKLGWTPLMYATLADNLSLVRFLVEQGADLQIRNKKGLIAEGIAREADLKRMATLLANLGKK